MIFFFIWACEILRWVKVRENAERKFNVQREITKKKEKKRKRTFPLHEESMKEKYKKNVSLSKKVNTPWRKRKQKFYKENRIMNFAWSPDVIWIEKLWNILKQADGNLLAMVNFRMLFWMIFSLLHIKTYNIPKNQWTKGF